MSTITHKRLPRVSLHRHYSTTKKKNSNLQGVHFIWQTSFATFRYFFVLGVDWSAEWDTLVWKTSWQEVTKLYLSYKIINRGIEKIT